MLAGLILAAWLNLFQPRALFLVFLAFVFLILSDKLLPDPSTLTTADQPYWFLLMAMMEALFGICALATCAKQAPAVAGFCGWNIVGHAIGFYSFTRLGQYDDAYNAMIRAGEISQVVALSLLSRHVMHLVAWRKNNNEEEQDGGHQFLSTPR